MPNKEVLLHFSISAYFIFTTIRQCTYHVTLRCVYIPIVAVDEQKVLHTLKVCVCSLRYPAYNMNAPYCHLWPVQLYYIFHHYVLNGTILENKFTENKIRVMIFFTTFVWNICHSKKNLARCDQKCVLVLT